MKFFPELEEVKKIAADGKYRVLPVSCEMLSDFTTPIETMKILKNVSTHCYMLESAMANDKWGRYTLEEGEAESCNGLLIMDVDYFKQVNDTYGHIVGDKVLKTFGYLLARQFREHDIAGRIGGDEFMVLIRNINNGSIAENRVKKLIDEVRSLEIPEMDGNGITISVGLAFSPEHGTTFMELYRHADTALYQVKQGGRNGFSVYEKAN